MLLSTRVYLHRRAKNKEIMKYVLWFLLYFFIFAIMLLHEQRILFIVYNIIINIQYLFGMFVQVNAKPSLQVCQAVSWAYKYNLYIVIVLYKSNMVNTIAITVYI